MLGLRILWQFLHANSVSKTIQNLTCGARAVFFKTIDLSLRSFISTESLKHTDSPLQKQGLGFLRFRFIRLTRGLGPKTLNLIRSVSVKAVYSNSWFIPAKNPERQDPKHDPKSYRLDHARTNFWFKV